jgi:hypothetical protein
MMDLFMACYPFSIRIKLGEVMLERIRIMEVYISRSYQNAFKFPQ